MTQKLFTTAALTLTLAYANAQITQYEHPSTILGQEDIIIKSGEKFTPQLDHLIIHDVDDTTSNKYSIKILEGENYTLNNGQVTPKKRLNGLIEVMVQVNDGHFDSNVYPLKVQVGERELDDKNAIYVATDGNDSAAGTITKPVRTLAKAKELVRSRGAKVVYFRGGEYYMDSAVTFSKEDSGDRLNPIIYTAYKDEKVQFTGSKSLPYDLFKKADPELLTRLDNHYVKAKIKVIDLNKLGITDFGEFGQVGYAVRNQPIPAAALTVNDATMHLARYPNVGNFNDVGSVIELPREDKPYTDFGDKGTTAEKTIFKTKSGLPFKWKQTGDIWIDGSLSKAWEWQKNKIATLDADSTITMAYEYHSRISKYDVKMFYYNIFEELDFPEEYFLDRENGLLYVFFPSSVNEKSDIRIRQSDEPFIVLDGVENVSFESIKFEGTRNSAIITKRPSSFNTFDRCEISSCGLSGVEINGYGNVIKNTIINNVGANGVSLNGGDRSKMQHAGNKVENCKIHDFSQERRVYNAGLNLSGIGQIARHVELYNGPHMAAVIRGVDNVFEYCDVHDAPHEYSDMLAVYFCTGSDFFSRGTIIRHSKFHDVSGTWKQSAGVYMDNETNGVVVEDCYFYNNVAEQNGWSVMVHGGGDCVVRRNVFVDCSYPYCISTRLNGYAKAQFELTLKRWEEQAQKQMNDTWRRAYPELMDYFADGKKSTGKIAFDIEHDAEGNVTNYWNMRSPTTNTFTDNLVYNASPETFVMGKTNPKSNFENRGFYTVNYFRVIDGKAQDNLIHSNNHNLTADPNFIDYKEHDLRVKSDAKIIESLPHLSSDAYTKIGTIKSKAIGTR